MKNMNKKHMWLMLACCLIPLAALVAIYFFHIPVSRVLLFGMVLFCPLSHVLMMAFMGKNMMGHDHEKPQEHLPAGSHVHTTEPE